MHYPLGPFRIEISTRRNFPLIATGDICAAEPDVGRPRPYFQNFELHTLAGRNAAFLRLTEDEIDRIKEEVWDVLREDS